MSRLRYFAVLLLMAAVFAGCASVSSYTKEEGDDLIVPGERVSKFIISKTSMKQIYTKTTPKESYKKQGLDFLFDKKDKLAVIVVSSTKFKTEDGIKIGDNLIKVMLEHGTGEEEPVDIEEVDAQIKAKGNKLVYPGIEFVMVDKRVVTIIVLIN
ncbi:MAG: hypothetical protein ABH868_02805 [bacterium]